MPQMQRTDDSVRVSKPKFRYFFISSGSQLSASSIQAQTHFIGASRNNSISTMYVHKYENRGQIFLTSPEEEEEVS
jgi:hypothetical protein